MYHAYVRSDLFDAGPRDDGQPFHAERFYVVVENARGTRFRHVASWNGTRCMTCEETGEPYFPDLRPEASAKAERLAERVNQALACGKGIDWAYWFKIEPVYGSEEYQAQLMMG